MRKILVSSCLLGQPVRYNGTDMKQASFILDRWADERRIVAVCPELAGGFSVPRPAAEIEGGNGLDVLDGVASVRTNAGGEVTAQFVLGAEQALEVAQRNDIRVAVLTDGSPSCGNSYIYDGSFSGAKRLGEWGVTASLLRKNGIAVFHQGEIEQADRCLRNLL